MSGFELDSELLCLIERVRLDLGFGRGHEGRSRKGGQQEQRQDEKVQDLFRVVCLEGRFFFLFFCFASFSSVLFRNN